MSASTVVSNVRSRTRNMVNHALKTMGEEESDEPQTGIMRSLIWNIEQKEKVSTEFIFLNYKKNIPFFNLFSFS